VSAGGGCGTLATIRTRTVTTAIMNIDHTAARRH
jgi:hypothetical protein